MPAVLRPFFPFAVLVLLTALVIPWLTRHTDKPGEWYPFSSLPMYSSFDERTYYVFITDLSDKPVAASVVLSASCSDIKKTYDRKLAAAKKAARSKARQAELPMELRRPAAEEVLRWLAQSVRDQSQLRALDGLRLHQVDISLQAGAVSKRSTAVGEITLASLGFPSPPASSSPSPR